LAATKLPSMKHSARSSWHCSCKTAARSWIMRSKTSWSTHCWKRRWQVWYVGYRSGRSFQRAPLHKTHKMRFRTARSFTHRRPLPPGRWGGTRIRGARHSHAHPSGQPWFLLLCLIHLS
jgi:hypothetical protein